MNGIAPIERLDVTVIIDNVTDSLSSNPPGVLAEWPALIGRGRMRLLSGDGMCCAHHGLSLLLEAHTGSESTSVLFDVGPEGAIFERNVSILGLDPAEVSHIVLSHGHWDHGGCLVPVIETIARARAGKALSCHLHPGMFARRGIRLPSGVVLPMESIANPGALARAGAQVVNTREPHSFAGCFYLSGEIPRKTSYETGFPNQVRWDEDHGEWKPDPLLTDERYLAVHVKDAGMIVFSACSHAGIINVLFDAREKFPGVPLHAVFGGLHLSGSTEAVIPQTVADLKQFELQLLAPGHCTGWRALAELAKEPRGLVPLAVGKRYTI